MPNTLTLLMGSPQNVNIGGHQIQSPVVRARNSVGAPIVNTQVRWHIDVPAHLARGTFISGSNPQNTVTDSNGISAAPFIVSNNLLGFWQFTASLVIDPPVSVVLNVNNIDQATPRFSSVMVDSGNLQSQPPSSTYSDLIFRVRNQFGQIIPSFNMRVFTLAGTPSDFLINGDGDYDTFTDGTGRVVVPMNSGATVGSARVQCDRSPGANPENLFCIGYAEVFNPNTPVSVLINAGNNQEAPITMTFAATMKAKVVDAGGLPVVGVTVTFTCPASGTSALFSNASNICAANTDSLGVATSLTFTANVTPGTWNCVASCPGATSANFTQSNAAAAGVKNDDSVQFCEV